MSFHSDQTQNHVIHNYTYANETERNSATGFQTTDVGKVARQTDNNSFWILTATTPTWASVADGGSGGGTPIANLPALRVPMLASDRSEFVDSGIRQLANGYLLMPGDTGFEADSLQIGDISTLHEANSFLRLSNSQFTDVRFDIIDARSASGFATKAA